MLEVASAPAVVSLHSLALYSVMDFMIHPQTLKRLVNKLTASTYTIKGRNLGVGFRRLDRDRDGRLDWVEFKHVIKKLAKLSADEVKSLFTLMDVNQSGSIEFEDFAHFMDSQAAASSSGGVHLSSGFVQDSVPDIHRAAPAAPAAPFRGPEAQDSFVSANDFHPAASLRTLAASSRNYRDAETTQQLRESRRESRHATGEVGVNRRELSANPRPIHASGTVNEAPILQTQLQAIAQKLLALYERYFDPERSATAGHNGFESFIRLARGLCLLRSERICIFDLIRIGLQGAPKPTFRQPGYGQTANPNQSSYEAFYSQLRACAELHSPRNVPNEAMQNLLLRFVLPVKADAQDTDARTQANDGFHMARKLLSDRDALSVLLQHQAGLEELFARYAVVAFDCFDDEVNASSSNSVAEPAVAGNSKTWSGAQPPLARAPRPRMSLPALEAFASEWRM